MDDLDHSMRIAEFDWTSFYDECEECSLLRPSLAYPDNASLSDSEDSENSSSVQTAGQREAQQSPDVTSDGAESNAEESRVRLSAKRRSTGGEQAEGDSGTQADAEKCLDCPTGNTPQVKAAGDITEETNEDVTNTLQTEPMRVQDSGVSPELKKEDGDLQTEIDSSRNSQFLSRAEQSVNEPRAPDRAAGRDGVGGAAPRAEKERWFVTVNDSLARRRARNTSVKKKRRQKKPSKNGPTSSPRQEESSENGESEINKVKSESEAGRDVGVFIQPNQNFVQNSGVRQSAEINPENASDSAQRSCEEADVVTSGSPPKESEAGGSAPTSQDTPAPKDPSQLEGAESDEAEDGVEFFSIHSCDSESYLSAVESVEETQHLVMENLPPVDLTQPQRSGSQQTESAAADGTQGTQTHSCDSTLSCDVASPCREGYERSDAETTLTFPSAGQRANEMPDDDSACDCNNTLSTVPRTLSDTPGLRECKANLPTSGSSSGDRLSPPPVPDLTVTPCSTADSPERYARAEGHARPVYAISAFWDEMEKLTINDILQLRMGRSTPPRGTQETATANEDESPTSHSPLVDTVDGGPVDTSDTADSDYFTQPDDSKPDRSSCEFSTSDFEEEYWQFIGASRNPSPDPHGKNQRTCDSPSLSHEEEEESVGSEGKETPVPLEDFAGQCFEDQESQALRELAWPRQTCKSLRNIQALNKNDFTLPFGGDESGLFLSSRPSVEENVVLKVSDSLGTLTPAPFESHTDVLDEHYQISFPEVFEYFFTEDEATRDSGCVAVYDPEDISVAPVFDYTLCTFRDKMSFSSLHDSQRSEEKPIPIFSCSHPTVRELTFPQQDYVFFVSAGSEADEADALSPIRVVSRSFILAEQRGRPAAAAGGSRSWKSLLSLRRIRFRDKGSTWCRRSGAWVFPAEAEKTGRKDPPVTVLGEGRVSSTPSQLFRELAVQQGMLGTIQTTGREGIFSTLKQADMCLVCIAFASWVLTSSDPEAADAWKAALLANVSALSAIQYLRQYVKKRSPPRDDP